MQPDRLAAASTISVHMVSSLVLMCSANVSSGQCMSLTNVCSASSFHKISSDVAQPLLHTRHNHIVKDKVLARWDVTIAGLWVCG